MKVLANDIRCLKCVLYFVILTQTELHGKTPDIGQLFVATHTKKSGGWVDDRSRTTYVST